MRQREPADTEVVRADPERIAHAAGEVLDTARDLATTTRPVVSMMDLEPRWFGTLAAAAAVAGTHGVAVTDAQELLDRVGQALEQDADGLYQVAFALRAADGAAADRLGRGWNR